MQQFVYKVIRTDGEHSLPGALENTLNALGKIGFGPAFTMRLADQHEALVLVKSSEEPSFDDVVHGRKAKP